MPAIIFALLILLAADPLHAEAVPNRYRAKLEPFIENLIRQQNIPGLAIAVVENNRVIYANAFGLKNLGRKDDPVTTRSLFHMASITKPFVATSLMQLVDAGKIDLDAPVVKYVPYFRIDDPRSAALTVRQMVTHTSGMPDVEDYEWDNPQYDDGALERYVRGLTGKKLLFPPSSKFKYSNMAFEVLGDVIAKVSGESFDDYVQRHILTPLAMKDSTLLVKQANPKLLTWGHERDASGQAFPSKVFPYNRIHSPSSNLHSSALDMARWAMANLNRGELDGKRIVPESSYRVMWKPADSTGAAPADSRRPTGISWFLSEYRGHATVGHGGGDTGYLTDLVMFPEKKIAVAWMTNCDWIDRRLLTRFAMDVALGLEPEAAR